MINRKHLILLCLVMAGIHAGPGWSQGGQAEDVSAQCAALRSADLSMLQDAPTQIISTKQADPGGGKVGYCEVNGYVSPSIGFLLRLPSDHWNGKLIEIGCGGDCGSFGLIVRCEDPLRRGYACILSNGGHLSGGDFKWAYNNPQAMIDYYARAPHLTAVVGKTIAERYYGQAPRKSYFMGCSAGGTQGMWMAQKFPWDFDGIVVGGPAHHRVEMTINSLWANRALTGSHGESLLGEADIELLHQAVLDKCDMNDGVKDGLIGDPRECHFDPAELRCTAGKTNRCLSAPQVEAVKKIYGGPVTSKGERIAPPVAQRGSERHWLGRFGSAAGSPGAAVGWTHLIADLFRYYSIQPNPGPAWEPEQFDFDRDYKRLGMGEMMDPVNPDLRRFKATGAKLLLYTGWNDEVDGTLNTIDYYETAEKIIGGRAATQDFFRLFVVPGMNHCGLVMPWEPKAEGPYTAVDYLSALEAWVEQGRAPDKLIASYFVHGPRLESLRPIFPLNPAKVDFTRPVYPYPIRAKYLGHGNPNDAANFGPRKP